MSKFLDTFLRERNFRLVRRNKPTTRFRVFGKYLGSDEYFARGDTSNTLHLAEDKIEASIDYLAGMGADQKLKVGAEELPSWYRLEKDGVAIPLEHLFLWARGREFLTGRLWPSSDGRGRPFPVIACIQSRKIRVEVATGQWFTELNVFKEACEARISHFLPGSSEGAVQMKHTEAQEGIRSIVDGEVQTIQKRLTTLINNSSSQHENSPLPAHLAERFTRAEIFGVNRDGWVEIIRALRERFACHGAGRFEPGRCGFGQRVRVPKAGLTEEESILAWHQFLVPHLDAAVPVLLIAPVHGEWLDILAGEPTESDLWCLRAPLEVVPLDLKGRDHQSAALKAHAFAVIDAFAKGLEMPWLFGVLPETSTEASPTGNPGQPISAPKAQRGQRQLPVKVKWTVVILASFFVGLMMAFILVDGQVSFLAARRVEPGPKVTIPRVPDPEKPLLKPKESTAPAGEPVAIRLVGLPALETNEDSVTGHPQPPPILAPSNHPAGAVVARPRPLPRSTNTLPLMHVYAQWGNRLRLMASLAETGPNCSWFKDGLPIENVSVPDYELDRAEQKHGGIYKVFANTSDGVQCEQWMVWIELTNSVGMSFVWVPHLTGTPSGAWVGKYEVTQAEYERVEKNNPARHPHNPRFPVDSVSGQDAVRFCQTLTGMETARTPSSSGENLNGRHYSLPTEDQWTAFAAGTSLNDSVTSRPPSPSRDIPEVVGSKRPNLQGLFDVRGNLWEWCLGDNSGEYRIRGSSYVESLEEGPIGALRLGFSQRLPGNVRRKTIGFRCVLTQE